MPTFYDEFARPLRYFLLGPFLPEDLEALALDLQMDVASLEDSSSQVLVWDMVERIGALGWGFQDVLEWIAVRRPDLALHLAEYLIMPLAGGQPLDELPSKGVRWQGLYEDRPADDFPQETAEPPGDEDAPTGDRPPETVGPPGDEGAADDDAPPAPVEPGAESPAPEREAVTIHPGTRTSPGLAGALIEEAIRLDVATPPHAIKDEPFDLAVAVRQPGAPPLAVDDLTQVASEEGAIFRHDADEVVLYRIEVTAAGCDVAPPHYVLKLRPRQNSRPCFFHLTPHRTGRQSIFVTAYQEDETVAAQTRLNIEVQVPVGPGGSPRSDYFTAAELAHMAQLLLQAGMDDKDRQELLTLNMNPLYRASLPQADSADLQLRRWLDALNLTAPLTDGELPFETFLLNAVEATRPRVESVALHAYLDQLRASQAGA